MSNWPGTTATLGTTLRRALLLPPGIVGPQRARLGRAGRAARTPMLQLRCANGVPQAIFVACIVLAREEGLGIEWTGLDKASQRAERPSEGQLPHTKSPAPALARQS